MQQRFESLNKRYTDLQALNSYREARTKGQHSLNAQQSADPAEEEAEGEEDEDEDEGEDEGEDGIRIRMTALSFYFFSSAADMNDVSCTITDCNCCL